VSRLMSLQETRQGGLQRGATLEEGPEFMSLNGGPRRHSTQPSMQSNTNGGVATIGDVMVRYIGTVIMLSLILCIV